MKNKKKIITDFGDEWEKFNQIELDKKELSKIFQDYFFKPMEKKWFNFIWYRSRMWDGKMGTICCTSS